MMEKAKQKKPRTIQMKYPAPYSQSWNDRNETTGLSAKKSRLSDSNFREANNASHSQSWANERSERANERASKRAKRKTYATRGGTQIVYPLPFANTGPTERKAVRPRKGNPGQRRPSVQKSAPPLASGCCHRSPDPTAPHLKYGLFTPKKSVNKVQTQGVSAPEVKSRSSTADHSSKKERKVITPKGQSDSAPPLLVFRAIDPRYTRQLAMSPPAHLDIRPRPGLVTKRSAP